MCKAKQTSSNVLLTIHYNRKKLEEKGQIAYQRLLSTIATNFNMDDLCFHLIIKENTLYARTGNMNTEIKKSFFRISVW